jgi:hypothetical protein
MQPIQDFPSPQETEVVKHTNDKNRENVSYVRYGLTTDNDKVQTDTGGTNLPEIDLGANVLFRSI